LWAWGFNNFGQVGNSSYNNVSSPVQIGALTNWYQVSCGTSHTVSVKTDNTIWSWGRSNSGQLGQNNTNTLTSPVQLGALTNWEQVSAGLAQTVSVKTNGTLWSWGSNNNGQLGDGTTANKSSPVQIGALTTWENSQTGLGSHCSSIKSDGTLWVWGANGSGALGDNTVDGKSSPIQVGSLTSWIDVGAGNNQTVAITKG